MISNNAHKLLLAFSTAPFVNLPAADTPATQSNIVFILSDDHSVPYLGCYGNPDMTTPNLDALAAQGARFNHMYTCAPQCVPSRATLMTGRNVLDTQMLRFSAPLPRDIITFPELLRKVGYYTGVCGRSYHLDGSHSRPQETADVFQEFHMETFKDRMNFVTKDPDDQVLGRVKEFLDQVPENHPFFLWVNYSDPHRPFDAFDFEPDPNNITVPHGMPDTPLVRKDLTAHIGEINRLDFRIGQVFDELKQRGLFEDALIVFMGDNGAALLRGKGTLYDCGLHVPFIARYPALIQPGTVSDILVSGSDLGPTILDIAGVDPDPKMTGKSFKRAMLGDETELHDYLFAVRGTHASSLPGDTSAFDLSRTVFNKKYRLIYNPMLHLPYWPVDFGEEPVWKDLIEQEAQGKLAQRFADTTIFSKKRPLFEFFDLKADPDEFSNLAGMEQTQEIEHQFKAQLHRWMTIYRDVVPLPIPPPKGHH